MYNAIQNVSLRIQTDTDKQGLNTNEYHQLPEVIYHRYGQLNE